MNEHIKSKTFVTSILYLCIFIIIAFSSGCSPLVKALAREAMDDGRHAKIKNQSFAEHFKDAMLEDLSGIHPVIDKSKK